MQSIRESWLKIKSFTEKGIGDWGLPVLIVLLGLASFGLGRLSALEDARPAVSVGEAPVAAQPRAMPLGGQFVASRGGTVYYYPWCSGALKIAPGNQVWFENEKAAQAAGFRATKNCKGLTGQ